MDGQQLSRRKVLLGAVSGALGTSAIVNVATATAGDQDEFSEDNSEYVGRITTSHSDSLVLQIDDESELEVIPAPGAAIVDYDGDPISLSTFSAGDTIAITVGSTDSDGNLRPHRVTHAVLGEFSDVER